MKRLAGIALGVSLLMPTLHYEAQLLDRVTAALDGGPALSTGELRPPVEISRALDKVVDLLHVDQLVG